MKIRKITPGLEGHQPKKLNDSELRVKGLLGTLRRRLKCVGEITISSRAAMTYLERLRTHVPSLSCEFAISTVLFWKKIYYGKPQYMCFKFIKTEVKCTLV